MHLPPPITSRTNARVKALRLAFQGKASQPGELAGIEGVKSVFQAFGAGLTIDTLAVVLTEAPAQAEVVAQIRPRKVVVLTPEVMASVVDTVSPPPVAATIVIPTTDMQRGEPSQLYLLLEDIQDPGNLGTLLRSAEAFGVQQVFVSPGCANIWSPKVIRSSAGSVFRQPVSRQSVAFAIDTLRADKVRIVAAVVRREGASVSLAGDLAPPVAIAIGNEGAGLSQAVLSHVDGKVYIPSFVESLNAAVAGSVLLYEALSQTVRLFAGNHKLTRSRPDVHESL